MTKPFEHWTVLPHGTLNQIDEGLWTVTGDLRMPLGVFPRRMTVVRLCDQRLVVYSAIALDEGEMKRLESFGMPAYLVVPSGLHRLDAKIWKDRYPGMTVIAPPRARAKVDEVVPVDTTRCDFGDPRVRLVTVAGTGEHELALEVDGVHGTTLVVNDFLWNIADRPGLSGFVLKLLGFSGEPKVPSLIARRVVEDEAALKLQLETWAHIPDLRCILPAHGQPVIDDPRGALSRIASHFAG